MSEKFATEPLASPSPLHEGEARKRVTQACNRCRVKKIKCTGEIPCPRCAADDAVCQFGMRRQSSDKPVSHSYVNQLEVQQKILTQALKAVWKKYAPPEERARYGEDSIHCIVSQLGILETNVADLGSCEPQSQQSASSHSSPPSPTRCVTEYADVAALGIPPCDVAPISSSMKTNGGDISPHYGDYDQRQHSFMMPPLSGSGNHAGRDVLKTAYGAPNGLQGSPARSSRASFDGSEDLYYHGVTLSPMSNDYFDYTMGDSQQQQQHVSSLSSLHQQQQEHFANLGANTTPLHLVGLAEPHWQYPSATEFISMVQSLPGLNHVEEPYEKLWQDFVHEMPEGTPAVEWSDLARGPAT